MSMPVEQQTAVASDGEQPQADLPFTVAAEVDQGAKAEAQTIAATGSPAVIKTEQLAEPRETSVAETSLSVAHATPPAPPAHPPQSAAQHDAAAPSQDHSMTMPSIKGEEDAATTLEPITPSKAGDEAVSSPQRSAEPGVAPAPPLNNGADSSVDAAAAASSPIKAQSPIAADGSTAATSVPSSTQPTPTKRARRPEPFFLSSRTFAPLPQDPPKRREGAAGAKRAERKSKMDALSAMNGRGDGAAGTINNDATAPTPLHHPSHKPLGKLTALAKPLPLYQGQDQAGPSREAEANCIPTLHNTPRHPPPRQRARLFDLPEAPTFYPTEEEFADPLKYIKWVGEPEGGDGKSYGIVKIVPPAGWQPPFVLDQERFRFRTRVQRLNSLSADARASLNYLEQLQKFHAQQGHARVSIPIVDRRPLDLYQLKLVVASYGGYDAVARNRKWAEVTRKVGYDEKDSGHLAAQIKTAYSRIIYPFERFLDMNRDTTKRGGDGGQSQNGERSRSPTAAAQGDDADTNGDGDTTMADADTSNSTMTTRRRSARRRTEAKDVPVILSQRRRSNRNQPTPPPEGTAGDFYMAPGAEEQMCEICLRGEDGTSMLLCDECNRGYHMYCLEPPLTTVPRSEWYCPPCLVGTGNDYGFDDGETHTLSSFWKRAEAFRKEWWTKHAAKDALWTAPDGKPNGVERPLADTNLTVSEDDVEREFWRLINSPDQTVEVEYGADVHSTTHGSALPTIETHPLDPYARDGWNLNNLPILNGSLLRYIKSDISGMTVPWVYVGMMFSTFCWHNEDHYTYSINYQHFGDTKTWYGVPGSDAYQLEDALRKAAPDLFEQSPDLLFQLVTMMSPDKLQKEGVKVYALDQRANEFVITYPRAYHSGFNQGFNLNEAVNFALPDWIDLDLECVRRYQRYNRFPVFSHDELIVTVYQHNQAVDTAAWLQLPMQEMVQREIERRDEVRSLVPGITEAVEETDLPENEYQCVHCNVFCYLGQIYSPKSEGVACLQHGNQVCGIDSPSKWVMRMRFSDDQLRAMLDKTIERAGIPAAWQARLHKVITAHARPPLRSLRGLLHEGEKMSFPLDELDNLRHFVERANRWVDEATPVIARRHQRRAGVSTLVTRDGTARRGSQRRASRNQQAEEDEASTVGGHEDDAEGLATPEDVMRMCEEAELLPFDAPEIQALQATARLVNDFIADAQSLLQRFALEKDIEYEPTRVKEHRENLQRCEELVASGATLSVRLPHMNELQRLLGRDRWGKEAEAMSDRFCDLDEVCAMVVEGQSYDIDAKDHRMEALIERKERGTAWKTMAEEMLQTTTRQSKWPCRYDVDKLEEATSAPTNVAIVPDLMLKLQQLSKQVKDLSRACVAHHRLLVEMDKNGVQEDVKPMIGALTEARRLVEQAGQINVQVEQEQALLPFAEREMPRRKLTAVIPRTVPAQPNGSQINGPSSVPSRPSHGTPSHHGDSPRHAMAIPPFLRDGSGRVPSQQSQAGPYAGSTQDRGPSGQPQPVHAPSRELERPSLQARTSSHGSFGTPLPHDPREDSRQSNYGDWGSGGEETNGKGGDDSRKRKRGKRARMVFEEEVGIFVPVNGQRIFCLCRRGETTRMVSCDRCALWFHHECVHFQAAADASRQKWVCPMCCVKTERRYTHAEVKVKGMGVKDPNLWLDVRSTLRSTRAPVSKLQHWTVDEDQRIVLHLESFFPATLPEEEEEKAKRQRNHNEEGTNGGNGAHVRATSHGSNSSSSNVPSNTNALGSVVYDPTWNDVRARVTPTHRTPYAQEQQLRREREAEERHRQGMANLYSRGVSDAMILKWFIGWNGKQLVYPRHDRHGKYHALSLGTRISLAPDDPDGSKFMRAALDRDAEERRQRGERPISPAPQRGPPRPPPAGARPGPAAAGHGVPSQAIPAVTSAVPAPVAVARPSEDAKGTETAKPLERSRFAIAAIPPFRGSSSGGDKTTPEAPSPAPAGRPSVPAVRDPVVVRVPVVAQDPQPVQASKPIPPLPPRETVESRPSMPPQPLPPREYNEMHRPLPPREANNELHRPMPPRETNNNEMHRPLPPRETVEVRAPMQPLPPREAYEPRTPMPPQPPSMVSRAPPLPQVGPARSVSHNYVPRHHAAAAAAGPPSHGEERGALLRSPSYSHQSGGGRYGAPSTGHGPGPAAVGRYDHYDDRYDDRHHGPVRGSSTTAASPSLSAASPNGPPPRLPPPSPTASSSYPHYRHGPPPPPTAPRNSSSSYGSYGRPDEEMHASRDPYAGYSPRHGHVAHSPSSMHRDVDRGRPAPQPHHDRYGNSNANGRAVDHGHHGYASTPSRRVSPPPMSARYSLGLHEGSHRGDGHVSNGGHHHRAGPPVQSPSLPSPRQAMPLSDPRKEEMRALARRMKPNATEEEIEQMARQAMD